MLSVTIVAFLCSLVCFFLVSTHVTVAATSQTNCHTVTSSDTVVPSGYGSPYMFSGVIDELAMRVVCEEDGARLVLGQEDRAVYIYRHAFESTDRGWRRVELKGDRAVGPWFVGSASGDLAAAEGDGTVIAYMCEKVDGVWKCGCRDEACGTSYWQRQAYAFPVSEGLCVAPSISSIEPDILLVGEEVRLYGEDFAAGTVTVDTMYTTDVVSYEEGDEYVSFTFNPEFLKYSLEKPPKIDKYTDDMLQTMDDFSDPPAGIEYSFVQQPKDLETPVWVSVETSCGESEPVWHTMYLPL